MEQIDYWDALPQGAGHTVVPAATYVMRGERVYAEPGDHIVSYRDQAGIQATVVESQHCSACHPVPSPYASWLPFHFGRANSGVRTACGRLLLISQVDCGHIVRPDGNLDAVTCGRCQRTSAYRTAQQLQAAGK